MNAAVCARVVPLLAIRSACSVASVSLCLLQQTDDVDPLFCRHPMYIPWLSRITQQCLQVQRSRSVCGSCGTCIAMLCKRGRREEGGNKLCLWREGFRVKDETAGRRGGGVFLLPPRGNLPSFQQYREGEEKRARGSVGSHTTEARDCRSLFSLRQGEIAIIAVVAEAPPPLVYTAELPQDPRGELFGVHLEAGCKPRKEQGYSRHILSLTCQGELAGTMAGKGDV